MLSSTSLQLQKLLRSHFLFSAIVHIFATINTGDANIYELLNRANCFIQEYFLHKKLSTERNHSLDIASYSEHKRSTGLRFQELDNYMETLYIYCVRKIRDIIVLRDFENEIGTSIDNFSHLVSEDLADLDSLPPKVRENHPPETVSLLRLWIKQNPNGPYPTPQDYDMLVAKTGLTKTQIQYWMANFRKRQN